MEQFFVPFHEGNEGIIKKLIPKFGNNILDEIKVNLSKNHHLDVFLNSTVLFFPNDSDSYCTESGQNSYIDISFENSFVAITHYMFRFPRDPNRLRYWTLYGSNDSVNWYEIDTQEIDKKPDAFEIQYFQTKTIGYFSRFRFLQTGYSWADLLYLCMEQIDFYGFFNIDPYVAFQKRLPFKKMSSCRSVVLLALLFLIN